MAGIERLYFNLNPQVGHALRHVSQHPRGIGHDIVGLGKVHGAAVKRRNFRATGFQVSHSLFTGHHVRSGGLQRERRIGRAKDQVTTHTGRQIDHDVGITGPYALYNFSIKRNIANRRTRLGVSHVTMNHRCTGLCRIDCGVGDLLRTARHFVTAVLRTARTGEGRCNENLLAHG